ncbi:MAG TPA: TonB-dependent receptor [Sphingobium sp.]|uniref:TonB-dependent receptor n=1 Tax=Sphingobium sp. TaxID=1912891 RepID=UPI002ED5E090
MKQFHAASARLSRICAAAMMLAASPLAISAAQASDAGASAASDAAASDDGDGIVVTARRREEKAQDVPIALSVVGQEQLASTGFVSLTQFQQLVPSMQVFSINPRNTNINIRGLGSNVAVSNDGLEYGVGVYVDNVYYARPAQSQFELVDLDRVEVLRGPQGTLFGKNTTAGAINITSRLPSFTPEAAFEGNIGNYGYHQVRGSVSAPLLSDKVAFRLSIADTHRDGFLYNTTTGTRTQANDNFTVRGQLLIEPTSDIRIRLIGDYSKANYSCCTGVPVGVFTRYSNTGNTLTDTIAAQAARAGYTLPANDPFARKVDVDSPIRVFMESYGASGQIDWDLGNAALTSITAYRWWDWAPSNDNDGTALPIWTVGITLSHQQQFSQELRLASTGHQTIDWVAGLYYFWQRLQSTGINTYGSAAAPWYAAPGGPSQATWDLALNGFSSVNHAYASTKSYAAFGQATWNLSDRLALTGGLRFTHEDKYGTFDESTVAGQNITGNATAQALRNNFAPDVAPYDVGLKNDSLTGQASLSYKIAPTVMAYASYARGGKSGGLNLGAARPGLVFPRTVEPEKVDAYEVGIKSELWDRKLTLNLAGYWTNVSDYQSSVSTIINGVSAQYIQNVGNVRSRGFEVDARFAPTRHIALTGAASYVDATYRNYRNAPAAVELQGVTSQDLSGQPVAGVSEFSYNAGIDAAQPLAGTIGDVELYGHADYSHRSSYLTQVTNSIYSRVPAYGIVNARVGLRTANGLWDVSAWARNLFNKDYFVTIGGSNTGRISGILGEPRTYGLTFRTKF